MRQSIGILSTTASDHPRLDDNHTSCLPRNFSQGLLYPTSPSISQTHHSRSFHRTSSQLFVLPLEVSCGGNGT